MRVLFVVDRLDERGGALAHLGAVAAAVARRATCGLLVGRARGAGAWAGLPVARAPALAAPDEDERGLEALDALAARADVIHVQNVMNPAALRRLVATGRAVVTVQDHRVFCPGPGRTLPDGARCAPPFEQADCTKCLVDREYHARMLALTRARRDALRGARLVALSRYMAEELALAGLPGAAVVPPWVEVGPPRTDAGRGFLLAGRLVAHKAPELALAAWRRAGAGADAGADEPLRVAGAGRLAEALPGATALGWLDPAALRAELRATRALLMPARWQEPFGIVALEALAQGAPVLAMATGGLGDWAGPGLVRLPPGDVEAMAAAMTALIADPTEGLRVGEAGRQHVSAAFREAALLARLWEIYEAVSGPRG